MSVKLKRFGESSSGALKPLDINEKARGLTSFHQQTYTLSGSDLPYHFVGLAPHSTSPIPWAEHLLLLR